MVKLWLGPVIYSATQFYDALLAPLGLVQVEANETYTAYAPKASLDMIEFYVTKPFDASQATAGNGSYSALKSADC